jgi:hypothetical protein
MELQDIMQRLNTSRAAEEAAVKTASAQPGNGQKTNPDALRGALRDALASVEGNEKTAAVRQPAARPTDDLLKMAEDLSNADDAALQKQAEVYGAAMCDGFMARFAEYEDAAVKTGAAIMPTQKTASADSDLEMIKIAAQDPSFQKFASENPELTKEAFDLGYQNQWNAMVKEAQDEFDKGYQDQMAHVHKVASACYKAGAIAINDILRQAA